MGESDAPPLVDAEDRLVITTRTDTSLFVEAGAGTGKTRSMVDRIVTMVEHDKVEVGRIAAITFTEAAARELRTRVRDALAARAAATGSARLHAAAGQVEAAAFTTLHGFALRILADHPVEAGLPPGFGVVDEMASIMEFDDAWTTFVGRLGDDMGFYELQERAAALNVRISGFASIAQQFDDNWDRLDPDRSATLDDHLDLDPMDFDGLLGRLRRLADRAETSLTGSDELYDALVALGRRVDLIRVAPPAEQLAALAELSFPPRNRGKASDWSSEPGIKAIRAEILEAKTETESVVAHQAAAVTAAFSALVMGFVLSRVERRRQRGELSFHDLLVLCRRLLRSDGQVRRRLHDRYPRLLLDEFQDTDPIQIELAVLLAHGGAVGDRSWTELAGEIEPGRLVVVGDPKQSIYRFRRADIATFAETEKHLSAPSAALSTNFRSVPGIVAWVNHVFQRAMGEGEADRQPPYRPLSAHREPPRDRPGPPVRLLGGPVEARMNRIRELEARDIAAAVCLALDEEWPVGAEGGSWRSPRLSDIAVLIPSRLSLPALEAAFSAANIPFRPETNSLVYSTQEVRDVLAAIRAIIDPTNPVDVVAALRSSLFAASDDDLIDWYEATTSWDYRLPVDGATVEAAPVVSEAFAVLRRWHHDRWWTPPAAMVDRVVRERRLREIALADPRPRDRWRRYRFLAEQAREFTETQRGDLHDFVRWAEIQSSDLARVTEPIPAEPDDDAVRLLTIHGSKGLEFPIVILAGAATVERANLSGPHVVFSDETGAEVKLNKGTETEGFDAQASIEDMMDAHERIRLHYVAATRASDHLVVSAYHKVAKGDSPSMGRRTWESAQERPELWEQLPEVDEPCRRSDPPTQLRLGEARFAEEARRWRVEQDEALVAVERSRSLSPSGLSELEKGTKPLSVDVIAPGSTVLSLRDRSKASRLGLAVHQVLELVDFAEPAGLDDLIAAAVRDHGIDDEREDPIGSVGGRVRSALASETLALAAHSRHWKELYVAVPVGSGLVEGYIDLCVDTDEGLMIVDYKTDRLDDDDPDRSAQAKLDDYRLQLGAYALALKTVTGRPVVDCRLLFLSDTTSRTVSLGDVNAAVAEVEAVLTRRTQADAGAG